MLLGRVLGSVVATQKNEKLEGAKLLLVQPLDLEGQPRGAAVLAIDGVDAGAGDRVLLIQDGRSAQLVLGRGTSAVDAAVIGVVDAVELGLMEDARIRELAEEVLNELRTPSPEPGARAGLEARVAALESEVARLRQQRALPVASDAPAVHVHVETMPAHEHPSHGRLGPGGGSDRCVLEPDKPCVQSGQCRSFGH